MIGETVGNYRILDTIGSGGMGVVYLAEHKLIGRRVAIKVLREELCTDKEMVARFFNEARSTALIKHDGFAEVFDFGHHSDGSAFIAMEYLEGESLHGLLHRQGKASVELIAGIGRQVASAVGAAHAEGIVHRDLKPDNIYLVQDNETSIGVRAKVLDFGIAKLVKDSMGGVQSKTRTGSLMGTPIYMSPEQCKGAGKIDSRADIYSLGCVLFEMACGRPPFVREGSGEVMAAHIYEPPPSARAHEASLPEWLDLVITRCLAKEPGDRFQTMDQLATELGAKPARAIVQPTPVGLARPVAVLSTPPAPAPAPSPRAPSTDAPTRELRAPMGPADTPASAAPEVVVPPPRRSRLRLILPIVAGTVMAAVLATLVWMREQQDDQDESAPVAGIGPRPSPAVPAKPVALPPPSAIPAAPFKPTPGATVKLLIQSEPSADVYSAQGQPLGKTPFAVTRPQAAGQEAFTLKRGGYRDLPVTLSLEHDDTRQLTLVRHMSLLQVDKQKAAPQLPPGGR